MEKKVKKNMEIKVLVGILMSLLFVSFISAQTIGGEVFIDSNRENVNPSWQDVFVYDVNDVGKYSEVTVSPDGYRYSFENRDKFNDNASVRAEILDFLGGFAAGPVDMNLAFDNNEGYSCEGCDIFQKMEFREVVQVKEPSQKLYIGENVEVPIELNVYDDCDSYLVNNNTSKQFCWGGCDYSDDLDNVIGSNKYRVETNCHTGKRFKKASISQGNFLNDEFVNFEKKMKVMSEGLRVEFYGNKSDINVPVVDFIPDDYEVYNVSNSGIVYDEDGYNAIKWEGAAVDFNFSYIIKPKEKLISCEIGLTSGVVLRNPFNSEYLVENDSEFNLKDNEFYSECNFSRDIEFQVIDNETFSDTLPKKIRRDSKQRVNLNLDLSQEIFGLELKQYVPVEFDISDVGNGGRVESSSSSYDVIVWDLDGKSFDFSYSIKGVVNGDFNFKSEVGGNNLDEKSVNVYTYVSSSGGSHGRSGGYVYIPKNFSKVGPNHPLIDKFDNFTVGVFSENKTNLGAMEIKMFKPAYSIYSRAVKLLGSYLVETNLGDNADRFSFEYSVPKDKYKDIEFYGVKKRGGIFRMNGNVVRETDENLIYRGDSDEFFNRVLVYGRKYARNWFDLFVDFQVSRLISISDFFKAKILIF